MPASDGRRIEVRGTVQGVGFRPWVYRLARELGLRGRVWNGMSGVSIEVFGPAEQLDGFLRRLTEERPAQSRIASVDWHAICTDAPADFRIDESSAARHRELSVPPDLATCAACLAELADPGDRRHGYAFINCTDCGPRFTIVRDVPYDRAKTTMVAFEMCAECRREYEDPANRRFHAEPNACPSCGPRLAFLDAEGRERAGAEPLAQAAEELRAGAVIAVKGIGGFHLACDASSSPAVRRLRERKRREEKPLAVLVRDVDEARRLALVSDQEAALLTSVERPIVLLYRRSELPLAPELVMDESPLLGLFLPYSPLHHLLSERVGRPLVLTSGNLADEPLACDNSEAVARLSGIADGYLVHDRDIEAPCDDSVARVIRGAPTVLRRARGWVPRPVRVARAFSRPVLAIGGDLKNAFCLATGHAAYLGPHIGDLETESSYEHLVRSVERLQRLLDIHPAVVAHDLHPGYLSTRFALELSGVQHVAVQHHHAHVASCMAEHGIEGDVIGVAYDGTGYGPDGSAWGGEILVGSPREMRRMATLRPLKLAGGDQAIRQPWRTALAALDDAFDSPPELARLRLFDAVPAEHVDIVRQLIARGVRTPVAHGCGRWFDAVGALVLGRAESRYEGQVAMGLSALAEPSERQAYPFALELEQHPWQLDLRPTFRQVALDVLAGRSAASIAARFENTLIEGTAQLTLLVAERHGRLPVVLSGGCFQNARLTEGLAARLSPELRVLSHAAVPPGDGGLALGQALVADALYR